MQTTFTPGGTVRVKDTLISLPFHDQVRPLTPGEERELRQNIHDENAVQVAIVVDRHGRLLDGHHRLRLAMEMAEGCALCDPLKRPPHREPLDSIQVDIKADVETDEAAIALANGLNDFRRHFTKEERDARTKEREQRVLRARQGGLTTLQIAAQEGVSDEQVRQDIETAVSNHLETHGDTPMLPDRVIGKDGKSYPATKKRRTTIHARNTSEAGQALGILQPNGANPLPPGQHDLTSMRKLRTQEEREARREERYRRLVPADFDTVRGPFPVIYADPPWQYEERTAGPERAVENHYPTMSLDDICALPVADKAATASILFLWSPAPKLEEALRVLAAWGFTYRTCAVWVKHTDGMGYWLRARHELLLIGKRGEMPTPLPENRPSSVIQAPRTLHSTKPTVAYEIIERMYPDQRYLELFARSERPGWTSWGNEVPHPPAEVDEGAEEEGSA